MRALGPAVVGVFLLLVAGFVRGMEANNGDPEIIWAAFYALAGCGLVGVLAAGVAWGIRLARD